MEEKVKDILPTEEEIKKILSEQPKLSLQSFETIKDPSKITPYIKEIISRQATINIGTIGHVAHGKTTLVRAISGIQTTKHKIEKERNSTWFLGYANAKLYKCKKCPEPECYQSFSSSKEDSAKCNICGGELELIIHISFVDCPGHDSLMATMLNGAAVMDAALLLVASNEVCPQPQTKEHLAAVENMDLENIIIIQNKIDLIKEKVAREHYAQIKAFVQGTKAANSEIIPISAQLGLNIDSVIQALCNLPIPKRDFVSSPRFIVVRSFDINRPGTEVKGLKGGVAGGTLLRGILRVGELVEIRPGIIYFDKTGEKKVEPLYSRIISLRTEENNLLYAIPGGLIAAGLKLDPELTRKNKLKGKIIGHPGKLPEIKAIIKVKVHLLKRLLGVKKGNPNSVYVEEIKLMEVLLVNAGSTSVGGVVDDIKGDKSDIITFKLESPICCDIGEKVAISRKLTSWRLIGWGEIVQ